MRLVFGNRIGTEEMARRPNADDYNSFVAAGRNNDREMLGWLAAKRILTPKDEDYPELIEEARRHGNDEIVYFLLRYQAQEFHRDFSYVYVFGEKPC